ncbi:MAG: hypothetical protein LBT46_07425 [Planctomycetaceae bacterium]|jgi:hypothetical protein|nr:hypothetical protein [Planctomycetaceae bacterium]
MYLLTPLCLAAAFFAPAQEAGQTARPLRNSQQPNVLQRRQNIPVPAMQLEMRESLKQLPWEQLSITDKQQIKKIVTKMPVFRKMPAQTVYADPEVYSFMLQHPDTVITFWQHLGATQLSLRELKKDRYQLKESSGTEAVAEILYRSKDLCIIYAKGEYRGPFLAKPCTGEVLLVLRSRTGQDQGGEPMIVCELDTFVALDNLGADMLAKMFYTSLGKIADDNFAQTVAFVSHFSKTAVKEPAGLKTTVQGIRTIRRDVTEELCGVIDRTALRAARREVSLRNRPLALSAGETPPVQRSAAAGSVLPKTVRSDYLDKHHESNRVIFEGDPFFAGDYETVRQSAMSKRAASLKQNTEAVAEYQDVPALMPLKEQDEEGFVSAEPAVPEPKNASHLQTVSPDEEPDFSDLFLE